ncbi:MAG TPA: NAD(P)/FAD-dependent oxidoreductase [Anaerolineales bacterium]|nr:NAD(P)/FAD-dependent oxidoreductase [Anaerolineales bacterium]
MSLPDPIIVLGAGHNGLTAAAYLAKNGRQVLVLERRETAGGIAATETLLPGYQFNTGFPNAANLRPAIIQELGLAARGFDVLHPQTAVTAIGPRGPIAIDGRGRITAGAERLNDPSEAGRLEAWVEYLEKSAAVIAGLMDLIPPNVKGRIGSAEVLPWTGLGFSVRRRGGREMTDLLRILPSSAREYLDENLGDPTLKGALAVFSTLGAFLGPYGAGTTLNLLYQFAGGFSPVFIRGGAGRFSAALIAAIEAAGGEVRMGTDVRTVAVENGRAVGVVTASGEHIPGTAVVSSLDPRTTLESLLPAGRLPVKFTRRLSRIRLKGSTATLHFALDRLPDFGVPPENLDGWIVYCPSMEHLERAYDDAKYGRASERPALLGAIPSILDPALAEPGRHTLSVIVRYAPYHLRTDGYERLPEAVIAGLSECAPNFKHAVVDYRMIAPADYETRFGLAEGAWTHGQPALDQQLIMRPIPGWSDYRTPVAGLWLCGSGSHPGGGLTGAPGRNAARQILKYG